MTKLLHIDASPRENRSRSRDVAGHFLATATQADRLLEVEQLDLWQVELPDLGGDMIEGRYALIMGEQVEPEIAAAWDEVRKVADHFLSFDAFLISTPMWNFGVPYRLKHYVDVVTQPGMTFSNDAQGNVVGHAAGKQAMIIAASALPIMPGSEMAHLDHQVSYLETWLQFIGVENIEVLRAAPTFGPPDAVEAAMAKARIEAEKMAAEFNPVVG